MGEHLAEATGTGSGPQALVEDGEIDGGLLPGHGPGEQVADGAALVPRGEHDTDPALRDKTRPLVAFPDPLPDRTEVGVGDPWRQAGHPTLSSVRPSQR